MPTYDIYEIKRRLSCKDVLAMNGIEVNRKGVCRCLFHDDSRPSMTVYPDGFKCFACQAHGDVIDLVGQIYSANGVEALRIAAELAGIAPLSDTKDYAKRAEIARKQATEREATLTALNDAYYKLLAEFARLDQNREMLAPQNPNEPLHPLFVEANTRIDFVWYALKECEQMILAAERNR